MRSTAFLSAAVRSTSKLKKPTVSLEHFIQRQKVISLWHEILRATSKIRSSSAKSEMRSYARHEFERNKNVTDLGHIRYLLSTGKAEFETMKRYIDEQAS